MRALISLHLRPLPGKALCAADLPLLTLSSLSATGCTSYTSLSFVYNDNSLKEILSERNRKGYRFVVGNYEFPGLHQDDQPVEMKVCYTQNGDYVGDWKWGNRLIKHGILAERATPDSTVCSIGFVPEENKWAGWSHRAMCKFGIGDRVFEQDYGDDHTLFTEHGSVVIETLDQARQAAINFADYVS